MRILFSVAYIAIFLCPLASFADEKAQPKKHPWHTILSPYSDHQSELGIDKDHRWGVCRGMTTSASIAAGAVYHHETTPPERRTSTDSEDLKELLYGMYPIDDETFEDQINQKIREIAYTHWQTWTDDPYPADVTIDQTAWDWCIKQPVENFWELH